MDRKQQALIWLIWLGLLVVVVLAVRADALTPTWSRDSAEIGRGQAIAVDATGNAYVAARVNGCAYATSCAPLTNKEDVALVRYSPTGVATVLRVMGGVNDDQPYGVAIQQGDPVVGGDFRGSGTLVDSGAGMQPASGFLGRYAHENGAHLWSKRYPFGTQVKGVASNGTTVVATGQFIGTTDVGCGPLVSAGNTDAWTAAYGPTGNCLWSARYGGTSTDAGYAAAVAPDGSVYVVGQGNTLSTLWRYSPTGVELAAQNLGLPPYAEPKGIALDGDRVVVVGSFGTGSTTLGGVASCTNATGGDSYLLALTLAGVPAWGRCFGSPYPLSVIFEGIAISGDTIAVVGTTNDLAPDLGGGPLPASSYDVIMAEYSRDGVHRWSRRYGLMWNDRGHAVAIAPGGVWITGEFDDSIDFGLGVMTSPSNQGLPDLFLARFSVAGPTPVPTVPTVAPTATRTPSATSTLTSTPSLTSTPTRTNTAEPTLPCCECRMCQ